MWHHATKLARQEQPRLNQAESDLQYIFLNGVAGIVARRQAEPKKYANNYNVSCPFVVSVSIVLLLKKRTDIFIAALLIMLPSVS